MLLDDYLDYLQESSVIRKILSKLKRKKVPKRKSRAERKSERLEKLRAKRERDLRRERLKRKGIL